MAGFLATAAPYLLSAVGGLFGKKPSLSPEQKFLMDIAQQLRGYSQGPAGSDPQEQAALASALAGLGQAQQGARERIYASLPANARTDTGDLMRNIESSNLAQQGDLRLQAMMEFLNRRRQALLQAGQVAGSVGPRQQQPNELPALIGQFAQQLAYNQAMKQNRGAGAQSVGRLGAPAVGPTVPALGAGNLAGGAIGRVGALGGGMAPPAAVPDMGALAGAFGNLLGRETAAGPGPTMAAMPNLGGFLSQGAPGPTFAGGMTPQAMALTSPNRPFIGPPRERRRF